ncbi:hypothetical protein EDB84DRAFT_401820 [Lactarius hengduanensis]|nr:hypothetical protein EDB84DRAFT_401820 [Lactarius hengduanensis]
MRRRNVWLENSSCTIDGLLKRDAKRDDLSRLSSVSTTTSISSEMRALSLMSAASSQTRASAYSSLFDSPPLLDPPVDPSSQAHAIISSFDTSHEYILTSRGRDYATVVVVSRAPNILDPPLLHFGDELKGRIVMRIDSLSDMRIMEVFQVFESDPVIPSYETKRIILPNQVDESCISGGQFSWPFVISPPPVLSSSPSSTAASGSSDSSLGQYLIRDHHDKPKVQLIVTFCRHGRLTRNLVLRQPIHYIPPPDPVTTPPPLIPTNPPTDPFVDPPGLSVDPSWAQQTFPVILVKGVMSRQLQVEVTCKLVVPVSHPISDVIPLHLVMTSESHQALDLLAVSNAIDVRLLKVMAFGENAANIDPFTLRKRYSFHHRTDWAAKAQWEANAPPRELPTDDEHPRARWRIKFNGMFHRDQSVKMSESFEQPGMALMYFVCLFPFRSTDFLPGTDPDKELLMGKLPITRQS